MNYLKIYNQIIERGKTRSLDGYKETHHIIPKCLDGNNDTENLVELTAREHFICHKLLTEIYPTESKLHYATWAMVCMKDTHGRKYNIGANEYSRLKENIIVSEETRRKMSKAAIGKFVSDITKEKIRKFNTGRKNGPHSVETIDKIKKSNIQFWANHIHPMTGIPRSEEIVNKIINSRTGKKQGAHTLEHRQKISNTLQGITRSEETKQRMRDGVKKRKKVTCPHCGKLGDITIMPRWHFDNCKFKLKD